MTASLTDDLFDQLRGQPMADIGQQLGLSQSQAAGAVSTALPLLIGALGRNAGQPQGADALFGALQRDHAGLDLGSVLGSVLGGGGQGAGILEHVLGGRQANAQRGLGAATGLNENQAGALLKMLAPIVMAYLARRMFAQPTATPSATASTPQGLGDILGRERAQIRQQGGLGGGLMGAVLDQDGDGDLDVNDLMRLGGSIFGSR